MCCLFGLMDCRHAMTSRQKSRLISCLAMESEARGTDAAGIAYNSSGRLRIYKRPGPAHLLRFHIPEDAQVVMGHTRLTTQGNAAHNRNNHPFAGQVPGNRFALAHNGVLYNDLLLRRSHGLPHTRIETDSYVAVQLIEQQKALTPASLRQMAETVEGSFVFTVLDEQDNLYVVKGDNPFCLLHFPRLGLYLYASTEAILRQAVAPTDLLPNLETEGGANPVHRRMPTSVPGVFAARDCTGEPLQVSKAVGEGLVAALSAAEYLAQLPKEEAQI